MTQSEFIEIFKRAIGANADRVINAETQLRSIEEYDSLGMAGVITMFSDEFNKNADYATLESLKTVADLMNLAGVK